MWLILAGLAILTGDVLSQVNKVIDSETDLLALPSDQLIHSSAELLALEDQNTGLRFGTRLSGYENPTFAYSYTIKETPSDPTAGTLPNISGHSGSHSTKTVFKAFPKGIQENVETQVHKDKTTSRGLHFDHFPHLLKEETKPTGIDFKNIPQKSHLSTDYLPPNTESLTKLGDEYLPSQEKDFIVPDLEQDYLTPDKEVLPTNIKHDFVPNKKTVTPTTSLVLDYLPPLKKETKAPSLSQEYLPPQDTENKKSKVNQVYFTPLREASQIFEISGDYLPPQEDETKIIEVRQDYLPPKEEDKITEVNQEYLPPKEKKTQIFEVSQDYLPPQEEESKITEVRQDYLPPKEEDKITEINQEYLPPKEEKTQIFEVSQDYLPPQEEETKISEVRQDYLPPKEEFLSAGVKNGNRDYIPPTADFSSSNIEAVSLKADFPSSPIFPLAIERTLVPPSIEFNAPTRKFTHFRKPPITSKRLPPLKQLKVIGDHSTFQRIHHTPQAISDHTSIIDEPIIPVSKLIDNVPLSVFSSFKNERNHKKRISVLKPPVIHRQIQPPPVGAKVKLDYVRPDSHTEIKHEPISFSAQYDQKFAPVSVVSKHKTVSIKPTAEETKIAPFVITVDNRDSQINTHTRNKLKPVSSSSTIINEPIIPTSENKKFKLPPVIIENRESPIYSVSIVNPEPQIKPIRDKSTTYEDIVIVSSSSQTKPLFTKHQHYNPPTAVFSDQIIGNPITPQSYQTNIPLSLFYKESTKKIHPVKGSSKNDGILISGEESRYVCLENSECDEKEVCLRGKCVLGCSIAEHLCTGDAICQTRHHVPACVCPLMFIAKTIKRSSGSVQFDCTPMMMMSASASDIIERTGDRTPSRFSTLSYERPIVVAPIASDDFDDDYRPVQFTSPVRASGSPCSPSPCGPYTRCDVNSRGIALCRCIDDYIPDGNTINGCKPQCTHDDECPSDYRCSGQKCVRVCQRGACGHLADCRGSNHVAICTCPSSYGGDPNRACSPIVPDIRVPDNLPVDPCVPNPCGSNADCKARGERPVCSCPRGYEGNPLTSCVRGECIQHNDCPNHRACQALRCIDPCDGPICGSLAECTVRNHQPVCSCPRNYIGDPLSSCRRMTEHDICNPSPCGENTNCRAKTDVASGSLRAVCSCRDNYIGNPLSQCRPECVRDTDCNSNQECRNNRCRNPCIDGCGEGAECRVNNHRAVCTCPQYFAGNPQSRCYPECTQHDDCPNHQACIKFSCEDPCEGACGTAALCEVRNHSPICSCPRDHTGDPFTYCRPFTPEDLCRENPCGTNADCKPGKDRSGNDRPVCLCPQGYVGNPLLSCQKGECESHSQCPDNEACYGYMCQSPCYTSVGSVCGENARCEVKDHQPVCSCPRGYQGNPLEHCRIGAHARIAGRSYRKK